MHILSSSHASSTHHAHLPRGSLQSRAYLRRHSVRLRALSRVTARLESPSSAPRAKNFNAITMSSGIEREVANTGACALPAGRRFTDCFTWCDKNGNDIPEQNADNGCV